MRSLTALCASRARVIRSAVSSARASAGEPRNAHAFTDGHRTACRAATVIACLALSLPLAAAPAQDLDDVSVSGSVSDQHGAVVPGARVTATHAATKATRAAVTDGEGRYRLVELSPGVYSLRVAREGFAPEETAGLELNAGRAARLDFTLRPAGLDEAQTTVSERDAPPVDTTRTIVGATLAREEIESLPTFTRSPLDFVFTLGGVAEEPLSTRDVAEDRDASGRGSIERAATTPEEAGAFSLAGGPAYSNNVTIDGLDNNDDRSARERLQPRRSILAHRREHFLKPPTRHEPLRCRTALNR